MNEAVKYPKTWHFPWSDSKSSDDHWHTSSRHFEGFEVVMTEKLDGENTSMYRDRIHARSVDSVSHPSQHWARQHWGAIRHEIPKGWRVCCENVYALHSIYYRNLDHYLYVIGIYDEHNICLPWDETKTYATLLGLPTVPELYRGPWSEPQMRGLWTGQSAFETYTEASARAMWKVFPGGTLPREAYEVPDSMPIATLVPTTGEGYVVRVADEFPYEQFNFALSKYVREGHVQTSKFWKTEEIIPNGRAA
jgi:hypothetical protein